MPDAIGSIGKFVAPISTGVGAISNFMTNRKQSQYLDNQLAYQKMLMQYANNPALMQGRVASFQQPLSQGLTEGVGNAVQANLAERGLTASPSIATDVMAQALAPYQQNEQQMAINEAFQSLGLPSGAPQPNFPGNTDLSGMIKSLLKAPNSGVISENGSAPSVIGSNEPDAAIPSPDLSSGNPGDLSSLNDLIISMLGTG